MLLALGSFCAKGVEKQAWDRIKVFVPAGAIPCVTFSCFLLIVVAFSFDSDVHSKLAQLERMPMFYILLSDKPCSGAGVLDFWSWHDD